MTKSPPVSRPVVAHRPEIIRWFTPSQRIIERLASARQEQKMKMKPSSTVSIPPAEDPYANLPHFVGILQNSARTTGGDLIYKQVFKNVMKNAPLRKELFGLMIPPKCFEPSRTITIVVYFVTEKVARIHKLRLTTKTRSRKKKKNVIPSDSPEVVDLVSSGEVNEDNAMKVDPVQIHVKEFVPTEKWRPFDPSFGLSTSTIKYNQSPWARWKETHPLIQIGKLGKKKEKEPVALLKNAIFAQNIKKSKADSDLDTTNILPSFDLEALEKILLKVVKFHQTYKTLHLFVRRCLRSWILKEAEMEEKKRQRKEERLKRKRELQEEELAQRAVPASSQAVVVDVSMENVDDNVLENEVIDLTGNSSSSNNSVERRSGMRTFSINEDDYDKYGEDAMVVKLVDLTNSLISSGSTSQHSQCPIPLTDITDISTIPPTSQNFLVPQASSSNSSSIPARPGTSTMGPSQQSVTTSQSALNDTTSSSGITSSSSLFKSTYSGTPTALRQRKELFVSNKLKEKVSEKCLLSVLHDIFRLSGLDKLLGSKANCKGFIRFVRRSIFLGGLYSTLHLSHLMASLSVEKCVWLNEGKIDNVLVREWFLAKVSTWIFNEYILVLLRSSFYVTEFSGSRNHMTFYLRDTWTSVTDKIKGLYFKQSQLKCIDSQDSSQENITGKLRFIPKKDDSVRTIFNYNPTYVGQHMKEESLKLLLTYWSTQVAPHGTNDNTSLHVRWGIFMNEWKEANHPKLYFLRTDIADAYPSVGLRRLSSILYYCQNPEQLYLKYYKKIQYDKNGVLLKEKTYKFVRTRDDPPPLFIRNRSWNTYKDGGMEYFNQRDAYKGVEKILGPSTIRVGKNKYKFSNGLPQGWSLSQLLCNIYYGTMDKKYFEEFINIKGEFFIRSVDDYFFVSPHLQRVAELYELMKKKNSYGFAINEKKTRTNITVRSDENMNNPLDKPEHYQVIFFGWKFCLLTGHVMRDFSAYAGLDISSTLSFKAKENESPEEFIKKRLLYFTPLRLHPLMYDPVFNCRRRILMNVMEAGLMLAFRFYAMCRTLYPDLKIFTTNDKIVKSLYRALTAAVTRLARHLVTFARQFLKLPNFYNCSNDSPCDTGRAEGRSRPKRFRPSSSYTESNVPINVNAGVTRDEIMFVLYHAFILKLSKHHAVFHKHGKKSEISGQPDVKQKGILPLLRFQRNIFQKKISDSNPERNYSESNFQNILSAVGTVLPPNFTAMKK